jgi:hypothetical protein
MDVPSELQLKLLDISLAESMYSQTCADCLRLLRRGATNPNEFKHSKQVEDQQKQSMWSSRGDLIKRAQQALKESHWSNATKNFEGYIHVLEVVFDQKPGKLTPDHFRELNKIEEMKSLILVLWELIQIHDGKNERLMDEYCNQLGKFGQCSPLKLTMLDKIKEYDTKATFKKYLRRTEKQLRGESGGLFGIFKSG